jgi:flagellar basal-body rod protein FlgG
MIRDLHTASLAMTNSQTRLEVTANNIANANTPAYKRASVFERNLVDAKASLFNIPMEIERDDSPIGSYLDWSAGEYTMTGNPLDVAIEGTGFFVCKNVDGEKTLTRSGSFALNSEGFLVTQDGKFVTGIDEDAIHIPDYAVINDGDNPSNQRAVNISIAKTGEVIANDVQIGKILVVECSDYSQITRISKQDFVPNYLVEIHQINDTAMNLKQGWLENSNVNIIEEMVAMIELQRLYETGSKVIHTADNTLERSINTSKFGFY